MKVEVSLLEIEEGRRIYGKGKDGLVTMREKISKVIKSNVL